MNKCYKEAEKKAKTSSRTRIEKRKNSGLDGDVRMPFLYLRLFENILDLFLARHFKGKEGKEKSPFARRK